MSTAAIIAIVIAVVVVLGALVAASPPARRRDAGARRRRAVPRDAQARPQARPSRRWPTRPPATGREVERAAALERRGAGDARRRSAPPAPVAVRAARPRGHRRHPPPVPQPRHRRADGRRPRRLRRRGARLPVADARAAASARRSRVGKLDDVIDQITDRQGLLLRAPRAASWITHYPADGAAPRPRRSTRRPVLDRHGGRASSALYQKCVAPRLPRAVVRHARSGSSARATARSTTRSARRRAARRRVAWTASPSTRRPAATSSIDTGTVVHGPADRHQHHRPGGRGSALHHRRRRATDARRCRPLSHDRIGVDRHRRRRRSSAGRRLRPRQHAAAAAARGRRRDRAGAQPQAVLRRRGARGPKRLERAQLVGAAAARRHRHRPARSTGCTSRAGRPGAVERLSTSRFAALGADAARSRTDGRRRLQLRRLPRRHEGQRRRRAATPSPTRRPARSQPVNWKAPALNTVLLPLHARRGAATSSPTAGRSRRCRRGASPAAAR